ncbi:MAG: uL14 family ribosomal protein [Nanoarchaeota archaeon]|nr:uL14 family ribosomal protein [Nanoarchaeota archaeon]
MKALKAHVTGALPHRTKIVACDNSGAKIVRIVSVVGGKTTRRRKPTAGVADLVNIVVVKGDQSVRKKVMPAIIVRQKKEYRRADGSRIKFESNAAVILKDEKGNPKGTMIKGPIAKEAADRWPAVAKIAGQVV